MKGDEITFRVVAGAYTWRVEREKKIQLSGFGLGNGWVFDAVQSAAQLSIVTPLFKRLGDVSREPPI